jgi:hypothetical protein
MLAVYPQRLLTGNAARPQNGSASTGKLNQSIVRCGNRSTQGCFSVVAKFHRFQGFPSWTLVTLVVNGLAIGG